jgi:hypothetical protein
MNLSKNFPKIALGVNIILHTNDSFIFGKIGLGKKYGKISCCSGHKTPDDSCWIDTAVRELSEEFKITLTPSSFMSHVSQSKIINNTLVFYVNISDQQIHLIDSKVKEAYIRAKIIFGFRSAQDCMSISWNVFETKSKSKIAANAELSEICVVKFSEIHSIQEIVPYVRDFAIKMIIH